MPLLGLRCCWVPLRAPRRLGVRLSAGSSDTSRGFSWPGRRSCSISSRGDGSGYSVSAVEGFQEGYGSILAGDRKKHHRHPFRDPGGPFRRRAQSGHAGDLTGDAVMDLGSNQTSAPGFRLRPRSHGQTAATDSGAARRCERDGIQTRHEHLHARCQPAVHLRVDAEHQFSGGGLHGPDSIVSLWMQDGVYQTSVREPAMPTAGAGGHDHRIPEPRAR